MVPQTSGVLRDGEQIGALALDGAAAVAEAPPCAQHENNEASERLSLVESEKLQIEKVGQNQNRSHECWSCCISIYVCFVKCFEVHESLFIVSMWVALANLDIIFLVLFIHAVTTI